MKKIKFDKDKIKNISKIRIILIVFILISLTNIILLRSFEIQLFIAIQYIFIVIPSVILYLDIEHYKNKKEKENEL